MKTLEDVTPILIGAVIALLGFAACEANAQPSVTSDRIAAVLPGGEVIDYPRDAVQLWRDPHAMDNIHMAFLWAEVSGQEIEIPAFASDSLIAAINAAVDEALSREAALRDDIASLEQSNTALQAQVAALRDQLDEAMPLAAEYNALVSAVEAVNRRLRTGQ